jgi:hypothetical protein
MKSLRMCLVILGMLLAAPQFVAAAIIFSTPMETPTKIPGPAPTTLFGTPTVLGNNLFFTPTGFNATSSNGVTAFTDGFLSLSLMTSSTQSSIGNFTFKESGAYSLFGGSFSSPTPNFATSAFVSMNSITARVTEIGGVAVTPIDVPRVVNYVNGGNGVGTLESGGIRFTKNNAADSPVTLNQVWSASAFFDVASVAPNATRVQLFLDNVLLSQSEASSFAFIDKKDVQILTSEIIAIPEPSTIILGSLSGLLLIAAKRRRRTA